MSRNILSGEFETVIKYGDNFINVLVEYDFYVGSTSAKGNNPSGVEIDAIIDNSNSNILHKLPQSTLNCVKVVAYEHALNNMDD